MRGQPRRVSVLWGFAPLKYREKTLAHWDAEEAMRLARKERIQQGRRLGDTQS